MVVLLVLPPASGPSTQTHVQASALYQEPVTTRDEAALGPAGHYMVCGKGVLLQLLGVLYVVPEKFDIDGSRSFAAHDKWDL